jgi:hypothetical protein
LVSSDGSRLYIGDDKRIDNWGMHHYQTRESNWIEMKPGFYPMKI